MKTNEIIINEGPLDFAKNVAAGFKGLGQGGLAGAKAAYGAQDAANKQADKTGTIVKKAIDQWNATAAQMAQGGQQATPEQATAWLTKFLGKAPAGKPAGANPAQISQFITQEIQKYVADRAAQGLGQTAAPAAEPAPAQAAAEPAQAQTAPAAEPAQATAQEPAAVEPAAPAAPAKPGANEFAQKLQADFEAFVNAGGSTGAPAVRQAIKSMWMQTGGTKAESKKNTKKPV
jgi:hypothetical protein